MILKKKVEVKVYPLEVEGLGERKFIGIAGISLPSKVSSSFILDVCKKISSEHNVSLQVFNYKIIVSLRHLLISVMKALRAFSDDRNICDKLEMEILLYVSGRRQIRDALELAGLPNFTSGFISVCIGDDFNSVFEALSMFIESLNGVLDWGLLELTDDKISFLKNVFDISDDVLSVVLRRDLSVEDVFERLVIERCALLDVIK